MLRCGRCGYCVRGRRRSGGGRKRVGRRVVVWRGRRARVVSGFLLPVSRLVRGVVWGNVVRGGRWRRVLVRRGVRGGSGSSGTAFQKEGFFLFFGALTSHWG